MSIQGIRATLLFSALLVTATAMAQTTQVSPPSDTPTALRPQGITVAAWSRVMAEIKTEQYRMEPDPHHPGSVRAANPRQRLDLRFSPTGVRLMRSTLRHSKDDHENPRPDLTESFLLRTRSVNGLSAGQVTPVARENRVEYRHPGYTEWYVNDAAGFEQGWTLDQGPAGGTRQSISLEVAGARTAAADGGAAIDIQPAFGHLHYRYAGLRAWDSTHRFLDARMHLSRRGQIDITVDARDAKYPITIDPSLTVNLEAVLGDPAASANDGFGTSVALYRDTLVVGAPGTYLSSISGRAYVFGRNRGGPDAWGRIATLADKAPTSYGEFGSAVAVDGDTVVVGAKNARTGGEAFIYGRNKGGIDRWGLVADLSDPGATAGDSFGQAVAVNRDTVVIGAPGQFISALENAYVYTRNQNGADAWGLVATLIGQPDGFREFGISVAIDGDTVVVGENEPDGEGQAVIYQRDQGGIGHWGLVVTLSDPAGLQFDEFGGAVAIDGETVVVGASGTNFTGTSGIAYVFRRNRGGPDNWGLAAALSDPSATNGDTFGSAIALKGDALVVGSSNSYGYGNMAYVFNRTPGGWENWVLVASLTDPVANDADNYGGAVAIDAENVVVSANGTSSAQGTVYVYGLAR